MQTVLAALDHTGCATEVLEVAEQLAASLGAELVLATAVALPAQVPADLMLSTMGVDGVALDVLTRDATRALEGLAATCARPARVKVRAGHPVDVVLDLAHEEGADWLVLGTHARRGLNRLLLGSVAEDIQRRATIPVVTVPTQDLEAHPGPTQAQLAVAAEAEG